MATAPKKSSAAKKPGASKKKTAASAAKSAAPKAPKKKSKVAGKLAVVTAPVRKEAGGLALKANEKARDYANMGKDRATGALNEVSDMIAGIAAQVDKNVGAQSGDYVRKAATTISGVADSLNRKDVDDLVADTRKFVKDQPAVALSAAAALGFVLTRVFKAGSDRDNA